MLMIPPGVVTLTFLAPSVVAVVIVEGWRNRRVIRTSLTVVFER